MNVKNYYQCCAVPCCGNTTIKTPSKLFIHVPAKTDIRNKWLELARVNVRKVSPKSNLFFCEDHFDLPNDMENYMEYHLMGYVSRILMKPMCLPSKFACQPDRKKRTTTTPRDAYLKRQRKELIEQLLLDEKENEPEEVCMNRTSSSQPVYIPLPGTGLPTGRVNSTSLSGSSSSDKPAKQMVVETISRANQPDQVQDILPDLPKSANKSIQAYITKKYRSKSSQTHISKRNSMTSPLKVNKVNIAVSPFKNRPPSKSGATRKLTFIEEEASESEISVAPSTTTSDSFPSLKSGQVTSDSSMNEEIIKAEEEFKKQLNLQNTLTKIRNKPRFYIGVPKSCFYLINVIEKHSGIPEKFILLCLKKIRLNTKFEELADEFGVTKSYASKIFIKNIPIIADFLVPFIIKLDPNAIKLNLPIAFRHKYHKVLSIIDCLEIEIEKPSKAIHQALTWSQYKKGNTVKYLISCTPDGLVNYISPGYGGRISDIELVENCDFLDNLPPGTDILADRGFKHLEPLLLNKGFHLLRPPSVTSKSKLSKIEAKKTKEIASLRIHVERVIRRVREFTFLKPHAVVNTKLIQYLDEVMTIACALINLQDSIVKR